MADAPEGQDIDLTFLNEIADGNQEFIDESIDIFVAQTPEILEVIKIAILEKDWPGVATGAHKLKSNLGFFGMQVSEGLCQEIESIAKNIPTAPGPLTAKFEVLTDIISKNLLFLTKVKENK